MVGVTIPSFGAVFCWSIVYSYTTPYMEEINVPRNFVSWVWLAGPVSGIIAQMIVGKLSDMTYVKILGGRRKPYMIMGTIVTIVTLLLFSHADWIANMMFNDTDGVFVYMQIIIAVISFIICVNFINCVQITIRSLIVDVVPVRQQTTANVFFAFFSGLGSSIGYGAGSIPFMIIFPFFEFEIRPLSYIIIVVLSITVVICCLMVKEKPPSKKKRIGIFRESQKKKNIFELLLQIDNAFWRAYIIQFMTFYGKFSLFIFITDVVGRQVFYGDPETSTELYEEGVRWGAFCLCVYSIVNFCYSPILNQLCKYVNMKALWLISQIIQTIGLVLFGFITNKYEVMIIMGIMGINESTLNTIPWAIVNSCLKQKEIFQKEKGLFSAIFNTGQCLPQMIVAITGYGFVNFFKYLKWPPGCIIAISSFSSLIGAIFVFFSKIPDDLKNNQKDCRTICKKKKDKY